MRRPLVLLGAERQAATSFALAYPERKVTFVTDAPVVDGGDLANVTIHTARPGEPGPDVDDALWIPLDGRWITPAPDGREGMPTRCGAQDHALSSVMPILAAAFPRVVLPVHTTPPAGAWIRKGDTRHHPDAVVTDTQRAAPPTTTGVVYQPRVTTEATFLVTGVRARTGTALGVVRVHAESFGREDFLLAGETVDAPKLVEHTDAMLAALDYRGIFTCNWIRTPAGDRLTALRPYPRAVSRTLRAGGVELVEHPAAGVVVAGPGHRFVVDAHYAAYASSTVVTR